MATTQKQGDRLDPALFAASFAAKPAARATSRAKAKEGQRKKPANGRRSTRRLADGRTTVRVAEASKPLANDNALESTLERPLRFDETQSMPTSKALRFKQAKLGLQAPAAKNEAAPVAKRSKRRAIEDPLGLEDPAFMEGGEFSHLLPVAAKPAKKKARSSTLRRGDAGRRQTVNSSRHAIPLRFSTSL